MGGVTDIASKSYMGPYAPFSSIADDPDDGTDDQQHGDRLPHGRAREIAHPFQAYGIRWIGSAGD